ncbi:MAG: hypothetical protein Q9197_000580 [Variospora fuerteventurae]
MDDHIARVLGHSELEVIVPQTTEDYEQLDILVVLRTPGDLSGWEKRFSYLNINLEAHVYGSDNINPNSQASEGQSVQPQARDIVWSGVVDTSQEPLAIFEEDTNAFTWVVKCFLNRPKLRMQQPMIYFKVSGIFRHPPTSPRDSQDPFLPSGVAASLNVLEPLSGDVGLQGMKPQLTASRLVRININHDTTVKDQVIESRPQKPFPARPAISARIRYSKSGAYTGRRCIIASLDIETAPFQDDEIELSDVMMQLSDGSAEDLCKGQAINLPMKCQPKDNIVFLFRLLPFDDPTSDSGVRSNSRTLDISIDARVLVSDVCRPKIQMRWKTLVDFSTALNPKYGTPAQALQRSKRPSSLSVPSGMGNRGPNETSPMDVNDLSAASQHLSIPNIGLTLTFTAPKDVYVGQPFTWDVFLVNHSPKPRRLAMMVIPARSSGNYTNHISKTNVSTATGKDENGIGRSHHDYAEAIMDDKTLYAMQKRLAKNDVGIVSLSPEVRMGTLHPGFCHNTELKFLPLAKGILHIEAVRVMDLDENKSVDVRDLPEIVAEERGAEED